MACPFCKINPKRTKIIADRKYCYVAFSNPRLMPGHLLVIPKKHVLKLSELNKSEREELIETLIEFQERIIGKVSPGCDIAQHYRPFLKQGRLSVDHLHFHLQPRELKDKLYEKVQIYETAVFKNLTEDEHDKISEVLSY